MLQYRPSMLHEKHRTATGNQKLKPIEITTGQTLDQPFHKLLCNLLNVVNVVDVVVVIDITHP